MIYLGKKGDIDEKEKVRALHIEINAIRQHQNFTLLSNHYGRSETGFAGRKLRLFPVKNKTKSDYSHKKLIKAILRQKSFLDLVQSDTNADILTLDTREGELDTHRVLLSQLMSTKYPNLPLFLSVDLDKKYLVILHHICAFIFPRMNCINPSYQNKLLCQKHSVIK
mmetsp:Transcript_9447/g.10792  ORF Transcript_9447/g.10792 Transcript_9447/m.10792 type:complete len:167 (+) Transcript_9447:84-584(+)